MIGSATQLGIGDLKALADARRHFWRHQSTFGEIDSRPSDLNWEEDTRKAINRPRTRCLGVLNDSGELSYIMGTLQIVPESPPRLLKVISELYVRPDMERKGIGQHLVDRLLSDLGDGQPAKAQIRVMYANSNGFAFWKKVGFTASFLTMETLDAR